MKIIFLLAILALAACTQYTDLETVDRSCQVDDDCVCTCECGCFNANETCNTEIMSLCAVGPGEPVCHENVCRSTNDVANNIPYLAPSKDLLEPNEEVTLSIQGLEPMDYYVPTIYIIAKLYEYDPRISDSSATFIEKKIFSINYPEETAVKLGSSEIPRDNMMYYVSVRAYDHKGEQLERGLVDGKDFHKFDTFPQELNVYWEKNVTNPNP